jgi:hypothetical protein
MSLIALIFRGALWSKIKEEYRCSHWSNSVCKSTVRVENLQEQYLYIKWANMYLKDT